MHKRTGVDLFPLDTKLEKTIRNLKKEIESSSRNIIHGRSRRS